MNTLGDRPNALNPSLTRSAWQPKSKPFGKLQHLHFILCCVALKISLPRRQHFPQWNWSLLNYEASIAQLCSPATLKSAVVGIKRMVNFYIRETRDDLVSGMLSLLPHWPLRFWFLSVQPNSPLTNLDTANRSCRIHISQLCVSSNSRTWFWFWLSRGDVYLVLPETLCGLNFAKYKHCLYKILLSLIKVGSKYLHF